MVLYLRLYSAANVRTGLACGREADVPQSTLTLFSLDELGRKLQDLGLLLYEKYQNR